jgi:hypothetical protein
VRDRGRVRVRFVSAWSFADADKSDPAYPNAEEWD